MHRRRIIWWLVVLVGLLLLARATAAPLPGVGFLQRLVYEAMAPLQRGTAVAAGWIADASGAFTAYRELQQENEALQTQIRELLAENSVMTEYRLENLRLRQMLGFKEAAKGNYDLLAAKVVARSPSAWNLSLVLDRGKADGVSPDQAVITAEGLVGRTGTVGENTAEVRLLTDPEVAVAAMVQVSRVPGVVQGRQDGSGRLEMIHLPHDAPVRPQQTVVSSGWGGVFPPGLRIGYIIEVVPEPNGLMEKAIIQPFADLNRLEEVFVVRR